MSSRKKNEPPLLDSPDVADPPEEPSFEEASMRGGVDAPAVADAEVGVVARESCCESRKRLRKVAHGEEKKSKISISIMLFFLTYFQEREDGNDLNSSPANEDLSLSCSRA